MNLILLDDKKIRTLIGYEQTFSLMRSCLIDFSKHNNLVDQPVRSRIKVPQHSGSLFSMPASAAATDALGAKLISAYPKNRTIPTIQGILCIFNASSGTPEAVLDAKFITGLRTSVVSALATEQFSVNDAQVLTIVGTGLQAEFHIDAHLHLQHWSTVYVSGTSEEKERNFVERMRKKYPNQNIKAAGNRKSAVMESDVICTVTNSRTTVLTFDMLKPSCHINIVGGSMPDITELNKEIMLNSRVIVDSRDAAIVESGDIIQSEAEIVCELGEYLDNPSKYAIERRDRTVFKALGLAVEDVTIGRYVLDKYFKLEPNK